MVLYSMGDIDRHQNSILSSLRQEVSVLDFAKAILFLFIFEKLLKKIVENKNKN